MYKTLIAALLILTITGCTTASKEEAWNEAATSCEQGGGHPVLVSAVYPKFLRCMTDEGLERLAAETMACLEAGNLPRYRGEVLGYGRVMDHCREPDTSTKVRIFLRNTY